MYPIAYLNHCRPIHKIRIYRIRLQTSHNPRYSGSAKIQIQYRTSRHCGKCNSPKCRYSKYFWRIIISQRLGLRNLMWHNRWSFRGHRASKVAWERILVCQWVLMIRIWAIRWCKRSWIMSRRLISRQSHFHQCSQKPCRIKTGQLSKI